MRKLSRRQTVLAGSVALLLGANLWHWWPRGAEAPRMDRPTAVETYRAEDFRVRINPPAAESEETLRRDPFRPKSAAALAKADQPLPPPKTPQQLEEDAARAELAQIKLVGVVVRDNKPQAFLVNGTETYIVHSGDKVGTRFRVEDIGTDTIRLKDDKTNVAGQVPISGK